MITILVTCALTGLVAGFLAGLLGIGGGLVIVPLLMIVFSTQGCAPEVVVPLALGTSLASIIFTSLSSLHAHHELGAVDWPIFKTMLPGIAFGSLLGAAVVSHVPANVLRDIFITYALLAAIQMLVNMQPKPATGAPGRLGIIFTGGIVGGTSMLAGIGGALITVPFMLRNNVPARIAIGTSAAIGLPVALAGTIGYVTAGMHSEYLPEYAVGFVHLPALAAIVVASMLSAPLGARISQRLPVAVLKRIFAGVLLVTAGKMLMA